MLFSGMKPAEVHVPGHLNQEPSSGIVYEEPLNCNIEIVYYDVPCSPATPICKGLNTCQCEPDIPNSLEKGQDFMMKINKAYGVLPPI